MPPPAKTASSRPGLPEVVDVTGIVLTKLDGTAKGESVSFNATRGAGQLVGRRAR